MRRPSLLRHLLQRLATLPQRALLLLVRGYQLLLSPWLGSSCRYEPSCSSYALQALQQHGALRGAALGGWRVLRCHPWCVGGHDPVPASASASASAPAFPTARSLHPATGLFTRPGLTRPGASTRKLP